MRRSEWSRITACAALAVPIPWVQAFGQVYFTEDQAAASLFPGVSFKAADETLSADEIKKIKKAGNDDQGLSPKVRVLWGPHREAVFIDHVLGKHEQITYAVGLTPDGKVQGVEVMIYTETYGYQIRDASWRQHFVGKTQQDPLKLDKDIPNISGATLSSKHVTDGVRRVIQTFNLLNARP